MKYLGLATCLGLSLTLSASSPLDTRLGRPTNFVKPAEQAELAERQELFSFYRAALNGFGAQIGRIHLRHEDLIEYVGRSGNVDLYRQLQSGYDKARILDDLESYHRVIVAANLNLPFRSEATRGLIQMVEALNEYNSRLALALDLKGPHQPPLAPFKEWPKPLLPGSRLRLRASETHQDWFYEYELLETSIGWYAGMSKIDRKDRANFILSQGDKVGAEMFEAGKKYSLYGNVLAWTSIALIVGGAVATLGNGEAGPYVLGGGLAIFSVDLPIALKGWRLEKDAMKHYNDFVFARIQTEIKP